MSKIGSDLPKIPLLATIGALLATIVAATAGLAVELRVFVTISNIYHAPSQPPAFNARDLSGCYEPPIDADVSLSIASIASYQRLRR